MSRVFHARLLVWGLCVAPAALPQERSLSISVTHSGCMLYKDTHFILHDDATNEVIQLNGFDLNLNVGNSVQISGIATTVKPAVAIATGVMNVTSVSPRSAGGCLAIAQQLNAQTQSPSANSPPPAKSAKSRASK
jgi:hypothetical protein